VKTYFDEKSLLILLMMFWTELLYLCLGFYKYIYNINTQEIRISIYNTVLKPPQVNGHNFVKALEIMVLKELGKITP